MGWVGFDFDGTLARHTGDIDTCGPPIPAMVDRVRALLAKGVEVRIVTARVASVNGLRMVKVQTDLVQLWCMRNLFVRLRVTAEKDYLMIALYDDRAIAVETDTGIVMGGYDIATTSQEEHDGHIWTAESAKLEREVKDV